MKKDNKIQELENRIEKLEKSNEFNISFDNMPWILTYYITLPISLPIKLIQFFYITLFIKPFKQFDLEIQKNKKYWIKGRFNNFEYLWAHLDKE